MMDLLLGAAALGSPDGRDFGAVDEGFGTGCGLFSELFSSSAGYPSTLLIVSFDAQEFSSWI